MSATRSVENTPSGYSQFFDGDVVIAKITPCFENGKGALMRGLSGGVGFGTTELHVLTPASDVDGKFLYYITIDPRFRQLGAASMTGAAGQQRVPEDFVRDHRAWVPHLSQQRAIADYLDRETARLDALVSEKERVLGLLSEKRKSLIVRAVTRGLDSPASLRDTGIPWLGEIPVQWEIWQIGHCASVGNGSTPSRSNEAYWANGDIPWLNSSVVNQYEVTKADQFVTDIALQACHLPLVKSGSVLVAITGQGKTRGRSVVLSIDATVNQHLAYISPDPHVLHPWFLRWTLLAAYENLRSISDDAGGTKGALTCEGISNFRVPVPPFAEQLRIVNHVATETSKLEELHSVTEKTVALIKERRMALIAAAVTGQIDFGSSA